jgi:hypothetical protein
MRAKKLKEERDDKRAQAAISIQETSYSKLISKHCETKAQVLLMTGLNNGATSRAS